ncbi:SRR1-like protein [Malaya genurostris]|uniref:SRR1-like protein n=1 Tax=Malaya genurostris TaxID=325434 RepID=UPI0026F3B9F2|nr:SRR1-like protein [Malaya genurostris]
MSQAEQQSHVRNSDGFILVSFKKRKHKGKKIDVQSVHFGSTFTKRLSPDSSSASIESFFRKYTDTKSDLTSSPFFNEITEKVFPILKQAEISRIICLGLGRLSECPISRHQLAFIFCLKEYINLQDRIKFFDPIFSQLEIKILQHLDGVVLKENLEGKYLSNEKTLFYLPHCPKQITNNILWKNWRLELLNNTIIISNSFESILISNPRRFLDISANFIRKIAEYCDEISLPINYKHADIFNDISLHLFNTEALRLKEEQFWEATEPLYNEENLEFITREIQDTLKIGDDDFHN